MKKKLYTIIAMLLLCGWAQAQTDSHFRVFFRSISQKKTPG